MPEIAVEANDQSPDDQIYAGLDFKDPKSFFLFAGAGSGKTRSLVNVLERIRDQYDLELRLNRKQVAVITYTNAASDEIKHRLDYNPLFLVSTIHSFVWELIKIYQTDIRDWLTRSIQEDIKKLVEDNEKGRPGTKAAAERDASIQQKQTRLASLHSIRQFIYSPTGQNNTRDSLNHSEVIKMTADLLMTKPLMREILVSQFPILFIDESQDTNRVLIETLFAVQKSHAKKFGLGLFGDMMQRIYADGKTDLGHNLPADWLKPIKTINYRSPVRVVTLINKIRSQVDNQLQQPRENQIEGHARLFIVTRNGGDKEAIESNIAAQMSGITQDALWTGAEADIKILTLEHHMAASRMGFSNLFAALTKDDKLRTGLLDGSLAGVRFFTQLILPIAKAGAEGDSFAIARITKDASPLLAKQLIKEAENPRNIYQQVDRAVQSLLTLWKEDNTPRLIDIVKEISETGLFTLPDLFSIIVKVQGEELEEDNDAEAAESEQDQSESSIAAWEEALNCSWKELERYNIYISGMSRFDTHQGVKGLQFPRVMVIIDEDESRGFMFNYDKLFGVRGLTETDKKNIKDGKETSIDRTLRLFYVCCSRAEKSLAVVAYTDDPEALQANAVKREWFKDEEIVRI